MVIADIKMTIPNIIIIMTTIIAALQNGAIAIYGLRWPAVRCVRAAIGCALTCPGI
jgi:hypothetical protein